MSTCASTQTHVVCSGLAQETWYGLHHPEVQSAEKGKNKLKLFSNHKGSLRRRQPGAVVCKETCRCDEHSC